MLRPAIGLAAALALTTSVAEARWYGSTMTARPNTGYGCEAALVRGPLGGAELQPTNQTSCTYRHGGYFQSNRPGSLVPATGRITRIRVKSGPRPARLRLTILTGSSRIDTTTGQDISGTYTCCTARYVGPSFRPRANRTTIRRVNVRVFDTRSGRLQNRTHATDVVGLSAQGAGTLPLAVRPDVGSFSPGTPLLTGFWPATAKGDPRVDGYAMSGIDLLFGWDFRR